MSKKETTTYTHDFWSGDRARVSDPASPHHGQEGEVVSVTPDIMLMLPDGLESFAPEALTRLSNTGELQRRAVRDLLGRRTPEPDLPLVPFDHSDRPTAAD